VEVDPVPKEPMQPQSLPPLDLSSEQDVTREQISDVYMAGTSDGILFEKDGRARHTVTDDSRPEA
jgi:Protein of unknown function (DUF4025)